MMCARAWDLLAQRRKFQCIRQFGRVFHSNACLLLQLLGRSFRALNVIGMMGFRLSAGSVDGVSLPRLH